MMPAFGLLTWLAIWSRQRELRTMRAELPAYAAAGWLGPAEPFALASMRARRLAREFAHAPRRQGDAAKVVAQYQQYATSLALLRHRGRRGRAGADYVVRERELLDELWARRHAARPALAYASGAPPRRLPSCGTAGVRRARAATRGRPPQFPAHNAPHRRTTRYRVLTSALAGSGGASAGQATPPSASTSSASVSSRSATASSAGSCSTVRAEAIGAATVGRAASQARATVATSASCACGDLVERREDAQAALGLPGAWPRPRPARCRPSVPGRYLPVRKPAARA